MRDEVLDDDDELQNDEFEANFNDVLDLNPLKMFQLVREMRRADYTDFLSIPDCFTFPL